MALLKSCKTSNTLESNLNQDCISNLPELVIDKILKRLPIKMVAKMSTLSWKWRHIWLSLKYLVFDKLFWEELDDDDVIDPETYRRCNCIVSNILFHHVGPVHKFSFYGFFIEYDFYVHGWVSLLSKVGVKKITLTNISDDDMRVPSSIYYCKDLVKLRLNGLELSRTPSHFEGFAYLESLELMNVQLRNDLFRNFIVNCPRLRRLTVTQLNYWNGWTSTNCSLVIDAPNLEQLIVEGYFDYIVFKNVQRLSFLSLYKQNLHNIGDEIVQGVDRSIKMLASSSQLRDFHLLGHMCKYFSAGCNTMSLTLKFLQKLRITNIDLNDFDVFCFTLGMIQWCPFIVNLDLRISFDSKYCGVEHEFCYNKNCELRHLVMVILLGIRGSKPELKLVEYLLSVASKLEYMSILCSYNTDSKLKVTQDLLEMPRASPKAKVVCK